MVSFKNETYTLPFNRAWVTMDGGHWSDYTDGHFILATSYPEEPCAQQDAEVEAQAGH